MPRKPAPPPPLAGHVEPHGKHWTVRVRLATDGKKSERKRYRLGLLTEMSEARAKEAGAAWLERMAARGAEVTPKGPPKGTTVEAHFSAWISGEMFRQHGAVNGLKLKKSADKDRYRAHKYVFPVIGQKAVADVTEQDIEKVLARVPADRRSTTRERVVSMLRRGFDLAIMPARLRTTNPVTKYHKPPKDPPKLFAYLFPAELLAVLRCRSVALGRRVLYALAVYTGLRKQSLLALTWASVDEHNRALLSSVSKTGIAQFFEIPAGLLWVLKRWRIVQGRPGDQAPIVPEEALGLRRPTKAAPANLRTEASALRADLKAAGVTRAVLFAETANIEPLRFHDMRATFTTWAKRAGKGDGWISDRTGHLTPEMIERYSRAARTLEDLRIEPFPDLTGTIPELVDVKDDGGDPPPQTPDGGGSPPSGGGSRGPKRGPKRRTHAHLAGASGGVRTPKSSWKSRGKAPTSVPLKSTVETTSGFDPRRGYQAENEADRSNQAQPPADQPQDAGSAFGSTAPSGAGGRSALLAVLLQQAQAAMAAGDMQAAQIATKAAHDLMAGTGGGERDR
jgi:integrase